jgi:hypothetical protein
LVKRGWRGLRRKEESFFTKFSIPSPVRRILQLALNNSPDFSTVPAIQLWNTLSIVHKQLSDYYTKEGGGLTDDIYDHFAYLYQAAESLVALDEEEENATSEEKEEISRST